jgi:STE24 endopeptidase
MLPWLRYVVFTDRLLEDFTEEEVEAVFGHEMGHVKHHHMTFYLTFLLTSIAALGLVVSLQFPELFNLGADPEDGHGVAEAAAAPGAFFNLSSHQYFRAVPLMLLVQAYIFVVFGFISRRCERQADIYGCRAVSCSQRDCLMHDWNVNLASRGQGLCPTGIRIFIQALEKVALLNGIDRDRPGFLQSWQHSTIGRRVAFLKQMLTDATIEPRFQRRLLLVKCALFVVLGIVFATLVGTGAW